ncbi:MAG TPA: flagellar motor protein MotB [Burkholderiales bacterium]|jgi:chemotaxis protein MotB
MAKAEKGKDGAPLQPIVIKRIKKVAGGHHGGAWKIAYADFVTAMMAFFLLMWLLGSTSKGDLKGIADYFNSPLKVAMQGGNGSGDSSSIINGGGQDLTRQSGQVKNGENAPEHRAMNLQAAKAEFQRQERAQLEGLKQKIEAAIDANASLAQFKSQIRLDLTADGLRIQIVDEQNRPMFDSGSAMMKDYARDILREIGRALAGVDHKLTLSGHTDAAPFSGGERGYSNWELSADRANAARRELLASGLDEAKILRVVGLASSVPFKQTDPLDPTNRRISIIVMNRDAERAVTQEGPSVDVGDPNAAQSLAPGAGRPLVVTPGALASAAAEERAKAAAAPAAPAAPDITPVRPVTLTPTLPH